MKILAAFFVRETAKLLEQPQVPPQTIKSALPFVATSKLEARLWRTIATAVETGLFQGRKMEPKAGPAITYILGGA